MDESCYKNKLVLVTGWTGFIGGNLANALSGLGARVRVLARGGKVEGKSDTYHVWTGDLKKQESLEGIGDGVDYVFHCAGILGKWGTDESLLREVNVTGAVNLLKQFRGVNLNKFVHLSAGGVTGPLKPRTVDETYPCSPATSYEKTKYHGECMVLELSRELNIPVTVARPTFTYGPGDPHKTGLFRAVKKGNFAFIGNGESVNHPVYIQDLIKGLLLVGEKGIPGEIYIIGGEKPVTKKELVYTISDKLGVRRPWIKVPRPIADVIAVVLEFIGKKFHFEPILTRSRVMMMADNFGYSIEKAKRELGYIPEVELEEGIANTVQYYLKKGLI